MPNYCENDLLITGRKEDVLEALEYMKGEDEEGKPLLFDFKKIMPYEGEWDRKKVAELWGTKWYPEEVLVDVKCDESNRKGINAYYEILYTFESAWTPPKPIIKTLGEKFPKVIFDLRYFEQGMMFNGIYVMEEGEVSDDRQADYFGHRGG